MRITHAEIFRFTIPMYPFTIATGTMDFAQNIFLRIFTDEGMHGVGECSAFPMITGETQNTCFAMARDFAPLWREKDPLQIEERMNELNAFTAFNTTIKSAFEMALFDIASKLAGKPLYQFLGASQKKALETDITIGLGDPEEMAAKALEFRAKGFRTLKIKLGKDAKQDLKRLKRIRQAVGDELMLRIDVNQGWDFDSAVFALQQMEKFNIQFCEQPMSHWDDGLLPELRNLSPIPIMADESVFNHYDAIRLLEAEACNYINIKLSKSGGIHEAIRINKVAEEFHIPCMMGGMLESRLALTAFAHVATALDNIQFYDMDTCMLGHKVDPVTGGVTYNGYLVELPDSPGIGAEVDEKFLSGLEKVIV